MNTARVVVAVVLVASVMALALLLSLSVANLTGIPGAVVNLLLMAAWVYFATGLLERHIVAQVAAGQAERVAAALGGLGLPTPEPAADVDPDQQAMILAQLADLADRDR